MPMKNALVGTINLKRAVRSRGFHGPAEEFFPTNKAADCRFCYYNRYTYNFVKSEIW